MPRFFFNHKDQDGQREVDIDGLVLPSLNTALEEAQFAAEGATALADGPTEGEFEIEDEGRVVVARMRYSGTLPADAAEAGGEQPASDDQQQS